MRPSNLYNEAIRKEIENITEEKVNDVAGTVGDLAETVGDLADVVGDLADKVVPTVESTDNGKVLTATYSGGAGSYAWATPSGGATVNELTYNLYNTQGNPVTVSDVYGKIGSYLTSTSNTLFPNNKALSEFKKASIKVRFKTVFGTQNAPAEVDLTNYFVIKEETTWDGTAMALVPKCLLKAITLYDAKQGPMYNFQDYLADMCIVVGTSNPDGGLYTAQLLDPVLVVEYF